MESDPTSNVDYRKLIPGWFTERMLEDVWSFGLMTTSGKIICITSITKIYQAVDGTVWVDAQMMPSDSLLSPSDRRDYFLAPVDRLEISINTKNIIAAFEISDT